MSMVTVSANGSDDTASVQAAIASGATAIMLPDAVYRFSGTVTVPAYVDIHGAGKFSTKCIQLSGFDPAWGIFHCLNGGYNEISQLSFIGNGVSILNNATGAISVHMDANATSRMGPTAIHDCYFDGFQQDNWIKIWNDGLYPIGPVTIEANDFVSVFGNSRIYGAYGNQVMSAFVQAWGGYNSATSGSIVKLIVRNNYFDGEGIAGAAIKSWQNVLDSVVDGNDFQNVGQHVTEYLTNYVCIFYTQGETSVPNGGGSFSGNKIKNRYEAGYIGPGAALYAATTGPVIANGNRIIGITRTDNATLRKAALSFNGVRQITAVGNMCCGNGTGIAIAGYADQLTFGANSSHLIASNNIFSDSGGSNGINVSWVNAGTAAPKVALLGNNVLVPGTQVIKNPGSYGSIIDNTV